MERVAIKSLRSGFRENYLFLAMICLVLLFGMYGLVKTPRKKSISENRTLTQFSHFTIKNFLNGKFQDDFKEEFVFSEYIKEKKIDKVLFVMGPRILFRDKDNKGLEK